MILSAPIYRLKRNARLLAREQRIPLHAALDSVAHAEGYASWSLLAARAARPAAGLSARLNAGDLVLLGARPGQGKTLLGLELAIEAMKAGRRAFFFSLEYNERDVIDRFRALGTNPSLYADLFVFDGSDGICADHIIARLADAPRGTLAVIDYLQLLDQKRTNPELAAQVAALKSFADRRGLTIVVLSQIDRAYDPAEKPFPDAADIRLPNPLDLTLFDRMCFVNAGRIHLGETGRS